ncbi:MAG: DUF4382 domain-containing protein [Candidatus Promineifilaceae bacterium]
MKKQRIWIVLSLLTLALLLAACAGQETGTLTFQANGEDFVRQGFETKDGWQVTFDQVLVTLDNVTAYQTDPPYDPLSGEAIEAQSEVALGGPYTVDLAQGGADAEPVLVGEVAGAPAGHYNALSWTMAPDASGDPLVMSGSAEKDGRVVHFTIDVDKDFAFTCGEYVGDMRKGVLAKDGSSDLEMTFHFDHIFGDAGMPANDDLNLGALGFDPFAAVAQGDVLNVTLSELQDALPAEDFQKLVDVLPTLGHVGEGHCHYAS